MSLLYSSIHKIYCSIMIIYICILLLFSSSCNSFYLSKSILGLKNNFQKYKVASNIPLDSITASQQLPVTTYESSTHTSINSITKNIEVIAKQHNFPLPKLTRADINNLENGLIIQRQQRFGRSGYGSVVMDIKAPLADVFQTLCNLKDYERIISTVKSVKIYESNEIQTRAEFCLSRFYLRINVVHTIDKEQKVLNFSLDEKRANPVIRFVDGFWFVEELTTRQGLVTRLWFNVKLDVSRLVPSVIVDYAAFKALPKASRWIQPYFASRY